MPIVLIIIGLAVAIGVGGYFLRPEEVVTPSETTILPETINTTDGTIVPDEAGDNAESGTNVPAEVDDNPTGAGATTEEAPTSVYANGAHSVTTTYVVPNKAQHIVDVTLTLADDVVTAASVTFSGDKVETSQGFQSKFAAAYQPLVIGKKLDDIKLSRVGGASLTTGAFNEAILKVKAEARN